MKYPAVETLKYSEIATLTYGAVIDDKGEAKPMSGIRLASLQREIIRGAATLLLRALDTPQSLSAIEDQELSHQTLPAVAFTQGPYKFIIMFDRTTKLPAAVRTRDEDNIWGDSNYDVVLSDWKTVGGVKIAYSQSYRLNAMEVQRLSFSEITTHAPIPPATFAVPDAVKAAANPPAPSKVPYQWVMRLLFLAPFTATPTSYFPTCAI